MKCSIAIFFAALSVLFAQVTAPEPTEADVQAMAQSIKDLQAGKEMPAAKLPPATKLGSTELRCGDYFIYNSAPFIDATGRGPSLEAHLKVERDGKTAGTPILLFRQAKFVTKIDETAAQPYLTMEVHGDAVTKITVRISSADFKAAQPCLRSQ